MKNKFFANYNGDPSRTLVTLSEAYAGHTLLRVVVQAFAGPLDSVLAAPGQKILADRIQFLINRLRIEMDYVIDEKINKDFFESEEWFDVCGKTIDIVRRNRSRKKIEFLAKILMGLLKNNDVIYEHERYMSIIERLTEKELLILCEIKKTIDEVKSYSEHNTPADAEKNKKSIYKEIVPSHFEDIPKEDFPFIYSRIASTGLIRQITGTFAGYSGGDYELTEMARKLIDLITVGRTQA